MLYVLDAWQRLLDPAYWWVHAMIFIYVVFYCCDIYFGATASPQMV